MKLLKKEWKQPNLEVLDISETMKFHNGGWKEWKEEWKDHWESKDPKGGGGHLDS